MHDNSSYTSCSTVHTTLKQHYVVQNVIFNYILTFHHEGKAQKNGVKIGST
jgi:hypothetical protein